MKPRRWLTAVLLLGSALRSRRRRRRTERRRERIVAAGESDPAAELVVVALLLATAAGAAFFVVAYAVGWSTQVLGGALGGALALLALALGVIAHRLVVEEEITERYPEPEHPEEQAALLQIVHESGSRLTRKRLLGVAGGLAGAALGTAFVAPAVSLGPLFETSRLNETPWRPGRRLVDKDGRPWSADQIGAGAFYTAYPEGADRDAIASPLVLVKLDTAQIRLPPERRTWAPEGILAYSKICTHAGCAIALYRNPLFDRVEPGHALVCPCHYSTFDPATGGTVLFGPAGRPLPQLPLSIAADRTLRAAGNLSGPAGPGWWGVRSRPTSP
jgi:ubiquinol-cytochrome c reductase iron-sulfur subunit